MKKIRYILLTLSVLMAANLVNGQRMGVGQYQVEYDNSPGAIKIGINLGVMFPGADFKERYGRYNSVGIELDYHFPKSTWAIGAGAHHNFGQIVKDDVVSNLRDSSGEIVGLNRSLTSFVIRQRGWHFYLKLDKLFFADEYKKSGLLVSLRPGIFLHNVRLQDEDNAVPHVFGEYKGGYDRLAYGPSISEFVGYQFMSRKRTFNFYIGLEATQAFTMEKRNAFFNQPGVEIPKERFDLAYGIRAGWILPLYLVSDTSKLYY